MAEIINHYELIRPFQNQNAGFSRWTIAQKGGIRFFIKEFMDPRYPDEVSLDKDLRIERIRDCERFEAKKYELYRDINEASDGNLVRIAEFFRVDSRYYMTARWIESDGPDFARIAWLPLQDKLLLCRTAIHSLAALHSKHIIHTDIKDTNVIVHMSKGGKPVAKIIDFDGCFYEYDPPEQEDDLEGDQVYLSPEACMFLCGEEAVLSCKMDVFAMGLLFHQYLTGKLPAFDTDAYDYAHEAVLDDFVLKADKEAIPSPGLREIIESMLRKDPEQRAAAAEVYSRLTAYCLEHFPDQTPHKEDDHIHRPEESEEGRKGPVSVNTKLKFSSDFFREAGDL